MTRKRPCFGSRCDQDNTSDPSLSSFFGGLDKNNIKSVNF